MHGQLVQCQTYDTFPATERHHSMVGTKLYCLVTKATCLELLFDSDLCGSQTHEAMTIFL